MKQLSKEQFKEKYAALPEKLKEAYNSLNTVEVLESIGKKHGLHIDKIGALVEETEAIMIGAAHPSDYIKELSNVLRIDENKARAIAMDVNEQLFKPIRDALKQVHKLGDRVPEAPQQEPQSEPPASPAPVPAPQKPTEAPVSQKPPTAQRKPASPASPPENTAPSRAVRPATKPETPQQPSTPAPAAPQEKPSALPPKKEVGVPGGYTVDPYREPIE